MRKQMFLGASHLIFEKAIELRSNLTQAELILWGYLKQKPLGYKFRRQHPIGIYIADFYCHALKVVIEVDGSIHDDEEVKKADEIRQNDLERNGLLVMRFRNEEVEKNLEVVISKIENLIINKSPL